MISPEFSRTMAAYNAEMNRRLYTAALRLSDEERHLARGAFWGSIHGTLCHLLWGDQIWMSQFDRWPKPPVGLKESATFFDSFEKLQVARVNADKLIIDWAERIDEEWLDNDLVWFSGAAGREMCKPLRLLVAHFFNHQTHHRGQVHVMLTAAGQQTGDTDLFLVI